jgi:hypothetical protein
LKERGRKRKEGLAPLLNTPKRRELKRGEASLTENFPLPLARGEG